MSIISLESALLWVNINCQPEACERLRSRRVAKALADEVFHLRELTQPKWTKEKPTVPGWYWYRYRESKNYASPVILDNNLDYGLRIIRSVFPDLEGRRLDGLCGEWAGPLPEPE